MDVRAISQALETTYANPSLKSVLEFFKRIDVDPLGVGAKRVVVADGKNVIKFAWNQEGVLDNQVEWKLWNKATPDLKKLLCPCVKIQDNVLVQKRCMPIKSGQFSEVVSRLSRYGILDTAVNLGWLDAHVVCYDYSWVSAELLGQLSR